MTVANLYAKYLLADRLNKLAESVNVDVNVMHIEDADWLSPDVHLQVSDPDDRSDVGNEAAAVRLLDAMPSLHLKRSSGLIYLTGTNNAGLTFRFYAGSGVCERVQTGTRKVMRPDPAAPLVEVEEPVFEVVCSDQVSA